MIPTARRTYLHRMDRKLQPLGHQIRNLLLAACASCTAPQGIAIYPACEAQVVLADGTGLVHIDAMVLRRGAKEEVGIAQLVSAHPARAKIAQMLSAFPLIGNFVAISHCYGCFRRHLSTFLTFHDHLPRR